MSAVRCAGRRGNPCETIMTTEPSQAPAQRRLLLLTAVLFMSYLCVGIALPVVPVFVAERLGLGNVAAGLGVGIAFLATILSRGHAGGLTDRRGAKTAVARGLAFYASGALVALLAGWLQRLPPAAF